MKTFICLIFLIFCSLGTAQNFDYHPADWALLQDVDFKFKDPIQQVESSTYLLKQDDSKGELWQKDMLIFENQKLHKWEQSDLQFGQNYTQVYNYFETDHRLKSRLIYKDGNLLEEARYFYDEFHQDEITEIKVKENAIDIKDASPTEINIDIILDENGNRIRDAYYNSKGNLNNEIKVSYHEKDKVAARKRYDKAGNWLMTDSVVYNFYGKIKEISIYPNSESDKENIIFTIEYSYNKHGYIDSLNIENQVISFEYELDEKGHWISRRSYITQNNVRKPYQLIERKITY